MQELGIWQKEGVEVEMPVLPELANLFPGYEPESMDMERSKKHIILTALARGEWEQIILIFNYYGHQEIKEIFLEDFFGLRTLPVKTSVLWGWYFLGNKEEIEEYKRWALSESRWCVRRSPYKKGGGFSV